MVVFRQSVHVESKTKDRLYKKLVLVQFSVGCAVTHLELKLKLTFQSDLHGFISPSVYGSDVHINVLMCMFGEKLLLQFQPEPQIPFGVVPGSGVKL